MVNMLAIAMTFDDDPTLYQIHIKITWVVSRRFLYIYHWDPLLINKRQRKPKGDQAQESTFQKHNVEYKTPNENKLSKNTTRKNKIMTNTDHSK